jgi:hypothetical protein
MNPGDTWLSNEELIELTRRRQPAAQARVLDGWGVPHMRRPDGSLVVGRAAVVARLGGAAEPPAPSANGLNWTRPLPGDPDLLTQPHRAALLALQAERAARRNRTPRSEN